MKISKDFIIQEFVPKETYAKYGKKSIRFIHPSLVIIAQGYKDFYKWRAVTINNWFWGGQYNYSGYRPPDCGTGAPESAHKRGMAIDIKIKGVSAEKAQEDTKEHENYFLNLGVTGIELNTPTWTHLTCEWLDYKESYYERGIVGIPFYSKK